MVQNWDFYLCRVDDAPASITLDLALKATISELPEDTLYAIQIDMADPGQHRMGTAEEAAELNILEDALVDALQPLGLHYIGRLRNGGVWQVTFMGPSNRDGEVDRVSGSLLTERRQFDTVVQKDADWAYYLDFLYPNDERLQWIQDRRVVESLEHHGDSLTRARRVDHWLYFRDHLSREACARELSTHGFCIDSETVKEDAELPLRVHRIDSVQLEEIHQVTTLLSGLAAEHHGSYDGWESVVETAS